MVTDIEPLEYAADEPRRGIEENRQTQWSCFPSTLSELVDLVSCFAAEELRSSEVLAGQQVHRKVRGSLGRPEGVIPLGQPDKEPWGIDAGLAGEADKTPR